MAVYLPDFRLWGRVGERNGTVLIYAGEKLEKLVGSQRIDRGVSGSVN